MMLIRTAVLTSRRWGSSPGPGQRKPRAGAASAPPAGSSGSWGRGQSSSSSSLSSLSPVEVDHDGLAPQRRGHRGPWAPELGPGLVGAGGVENRWRQHSQVGQPQLGFSCHLVKLLHSCHVIQLLDSCCQQARTQLIARPAPAQAISITTITTIVPLTCSSGQPSS